MAVSDLISPSGEEERRKTRGEERREAQEKEERENEERGETCRGLPGSC